MKHPNIKELYSLYLKHPIVCTDTRNIKKGCIFYALKGANFNANSFAKEALTKGAKYAVIDEEAYYTEACILVDNVLHTLQQLANHHRKQYKIPFLAITGSNGKTTTKELCAAVLSQRYKTLFTQGNLNNHIGVPLTLLNLHKEHEIVIIEMGANHQGEIAALCKIAEPNYGIITNIGKAHLEGFGGPQGVIKAKSELYHHIKNTRGRLFVNADDDLLMSLSDGISRMIYGTKSDADYVGIEDKTDFLAKGIFKDGDTRVKIKSHLAGRYNFYNMLTAACTGSYFGVTLKQIKSAIEGYVPSNNRSQIVKNGSNTIWVDAYNANPSSMKAAIDNFAMLLEKGKVLILGDMFELGADSAKEHQALVDFIESKKTWDGVYFIGSEFGKTKTSAHRFATIEDFMQWIKKNPMEEKTILLKGSRGMAMERLVGQL